MLSPESELAVYLAARYSRKDEIKQKSLELIDLGINCTSRWLDEKCSADSTMAKVGDEFCLEVAHQDIEDIDRAHVLVLFTEDPEKPFVRGGRHFEAGYAYGRGIQTFTIGYRENVFHYLPKITNIPDWETCKEILLTLKEIRQYGKTACRSL